ncbi:MAG: SatD family protein [Bacteroidota bacterium]
MKHAILMADIINSRDKESKRLMHQFEKVTAEINHIYAKRIRSPVTITLGDEFQGVVKSIAFAIELIFSIEELIIKYNYDFKLRYVLVYGEIDTSLNTITAHGMLGAGLTEARNKLNDLKKHESRFYVEVDKAKDDYLNKALSIYQGIIDGWKAKDSAAVSAFLEYEDYKIVAEKVETDRSSAWRRQRSLKIENYKSIKEIILFLLNAN